MSDMLRAALLPAFAMLAACGGPTPERSGDTDMPASGPATADPLANPRQLPVQVADYPALSSRTCMDVVAFYGQAISAGRWDQAALVWADPVIDGARLQGLFAGYTRPVIKWGGPQEEGAAGSLFCTVEGTLTDAGAPGTAAQTGTLVLRRVNDVDGATPTQLRWTIRSSSFIEPTERSGRSS